MVSIREVDILDDDLFVRVDMGIGRRWMPLRELSADMIDRVEAHAASMHIDAWVNPLGQMISVADAIAQERKRRVLKTWLAVAYCFEPSEGIFSTAMTVGDVATTPLPINSVWRETFTTKTEAEACCELHDPDQNLDGWEMLI